MKIVMSSSPAKRERSAQKQRTRRALLSAAAELVAEGRTPTVAEAADVALVSRATAYRYFPSQEALLVEVPLQVNLPTSALVFDGLNAPRDPEDRAALVHNVLFDHVRAHELQLRLFLRNALLRSVHSDGQPEFLRPAYRLELLSTALQPLERELDADQLERLKSALSVLIGTEAMIVMRDVLNLDHHQAQSTGEWAVRALVRSARQAASPHHPTIAQE